MRIPTVIVSCDVPGCKSEFSAGARTSPTSAWRAAKADGWADAHLREAVDGQGRAYVLIDSGGEREVCPEHAPQRGKGLIIFADELPSLEPAPVTTGIGRGRKRATGEYVCRDPECDRVFKLPVHRGRHETSRHPELVRS